METKKLITVQAEINAPVKKVWEYYTAPGHVVQWNHASDDWHSPKAENDLNPGGKFNYRMEAKDGSSGFDFWGIYDEITTNQLIAYTMGDGRKAKVSFTGNRRGTHLETTFEAESNNSVDLQRSGWQAILNNFKQYVEAQYNAKNHPSFMV